ncbi:hypothetical protein K0B96_09660 [Horticoccus luteus]|uniref:Uncharacterized protein n=1 Tax=Horticoccus luteus TaxID=2862869 RepID=A0A8F9TSQ4_9BACT|nr:hypothetical protein [Horticoccus luteus]QYM77593.1 hypothetical protein K0B96_09660 [Horticoccus luteus]
MKSAKNYVLVLLLLVSIAGGYVSWREYNDLISLRASVAAAQQREAWQKRAAPATAVAAPAAAVAQKDSPAEEPDDAGSAEDHRPDRRGSRRSSMRSFFDNPEAQKLVAMQQRAALDGHYATLFKKLALTPAQLAQFKNLLVEKQSALIDVAAAARAQGINPRTDRDEFRQMVTQAQTEVDNNIRSVLGDDGYADYQQYQKTLPQRTAVDQFAQRLSYTSTPLTDAQTDQLVQILADTAATNANPASGLSARGNMLASMGVSMGGAQISNEALTRAQGVLSPDQLTALQNYQQEQLQQQELMRSLRQQREGAGTAPPRPSPNATAPGGG